MTPLFIITIFGLKSILSDISIDTPALGGFHLHEISIFTPSFVCVCIYL